MIRATDTTGTTTATAIVPLVDRPEEEAAAAVALESAAELPVEDAPVEALVGSTEAVEVTYTTVVPPLLLLEIEERTVVSGWEVVVGSVVVEGTAAVVDELVVEGIEVVGSAVDALLVVDGVEVVDGTSADEVEEAEVVGTAVVSAAEVSAAVVVGAAVDSLALSVAASLALAGVDAVAAAAAAALLAAAAALSAEVAAGVTAWVDMMNDVDMGSLRSSTPGF